MKKFFRRAGRFLKKIWDNIKKAIAIILAVLLVVLIIYTLVVVIGSLLGATLPAWTSTGLGTTLGSSALGAKVAWLGGHALWVYAVGVVTLNVAAHMLMPNTMDWAGRRTLAGLKYVGDVAVDATVNLLTSVGRGVKKLIPWPLLIGAVGVIILLKKPAAPVVISGGRVT